MIPAKIMPPPNLPSQGPLIRTPVKVNEIVYYMKSTLYGVWIPGKVMKVSAVDRKSVSIVIVIKRKKTIGSDN